MIEAQSRLARALAALGCAALLLAPLAARAQEAPAPPEAADKPAVRRIDPRADELLRQMSALLAATPRFALEAEETFDEVSDNAPRLQLTNVRRIGVERPGRFATDATGDTLNRAAWYDGKTVTVLDKAKNVYVAIDAPATIDGALDKVAADFGVVMPLSDLFYSDPYATLTEQVVYGEYQGLHRVGDDLCHHLAFSQESLDWQIWIDAGDKPLPRKVVISYVDEPGAPQYVAVIRRFTLDPKFPEGLFRFEAPEGAERLSLEEAKRRREASK
jgi:hypothetical protein